MGHSLFKYILIGAVCFTVGYIKGCQHANGNPITTSPSKIERILEKTDVRQLDVYSEGIDKEIKYILSD